MGTVNAGYGLVTAKSNQYFADDADPEFAIVQLHIVCGKGSCGNYQQKTEIFRENWDDSEQQQCAKIWLFQLASDFTQGFFHKHSSSLAKTVIL